MNLKKYAIPAIFLSVLCLVYLIYSSGFTGVFIFDDIPNLKPLGNWSDKETWIRVLLFLYHGESGPTGRPVSLLTFLQSGLNWPTDAYDFKRVNVLLHMLAGVFVFLFIRMLPVFPSANAQLMLALSVMAIWLFHPLNVSTVLFVIQRMTILSALFSLISLIFYLSIRNSFIAANRKRVICLTTGLILFLLLAILSKENAALVPVFMLVLELTLFSNSAIFDKAPGFRYWFTAFAVIPTVLIVTYLLYIAVATDFSYRDFTLYERLLSESRALVDYLTLIIYPSIDGLGIFHDDYEISRSLTTPVSTLVSIIVVLFLILTAVRYRKKYAYYAFAVLWFFGGHLLESTTIPIELYFEHRNYMPMLGIIFFIVYLVISSSLLKRLYKISLLFFLTMILCLITKVESDLWGNPVAAITIWAHENPGSVRARLAVTSAYRLLNADAEYDETIYRYTRSTYEQSHTNAFARFALMSAECLYIPPEKDRLTPQQVTDWDGVYFDTAAGEELVKLVEQVASGACPEVLDTPGLLSMFTSISKTEGFRVSGSKFKHAFYYARSRIYLVLRQLDPLITDMELSYQYLRVLDLRLEQAVMLQSAGLHDDALVMLNKAERETPIIEYFLRRDDVNNLRKKIRHGKAVGQ